MTNRRRPIMVLGRDAVGTHDLLLPATDKNYLSKLMQTESNGCVENALSALSEIRVYPPKLPDPVNIFANVELSEDGALMPRSLKSEPGDQVIFRVLLDIICVVSSANTIPTVPVLASIMSLMYIKSPRFSSILILFL